LCRGPDPEAGSGSRPKSIRFVIPGYYRVLAVGLIFAGGGGGMAPKPEPEREEQTQETPGPRGSFSRGRGQREYERRQEERGQEHEVEQEAERGRNDRGRVVAEGRDWRVVEVKRNGKKFYNLRLYPGERGIYQILREEAGAIMEVAKKLGAMISYTIFVGGNKRIVLLIGEAGVVVQIPKPVSITKIRGLKALLE